MAETQALQGDLISIPALLARNARAYGGRTAYREKEFGIWQSWTWGQAEAEIRAEPEVQRVCTIRTRRGADVVEIPIPCTN